MNKAPLIENLLEFIEKNQFQKINNMLINNYKKTYEEGFNLSLKNTAELPMNLKVCGNIKQEIREGYQLLLINSDTLSKKGMIDGVEISCDNNGLITLNGTATKTISFRVSALMSNYGEKLNSGETITYISNYVSGDVNTEFSTIFYKKLLPNSLETKNVTKPLKNSMTYSTEILTEDYTEYYSWIYITSGHIFNNYKFRMMMYKGEYNSNKTYEQYGAMPSLDFPSDVEGIAGNVETKIQNKNYYNVNDISLISSNITVDNEDYISCEGNNISGKNYLWKNFFTTKSKILKPNTKYYLMVEVKEVKGTGSLHLISSSVNDLSQFQENIILKFAELTNNYKKSFEITTLPDLSLKNIKSTLRTFSEFNIGQSGSIKFRISILAEEVTVSKFMYTSYKEQIYQLSLGDRILYGDDNSRDYFDIEIDENLYNKTGYRKIIALKLVKNWKKYVFNGEEKIFFSIVQGDYFLAQYEFPLQKKETLVYSNKFVYRTIWGTANSVEGINSAYNQNPIIQIKVLSSRLTEVSKNGFQQFLKGKNIYAVYQLNKPEEELISNLELIEQFEKMINNAQSYTEETNVSSDAFLKIDFYKDKVLELEERLENLENK